MAMADPALLERLAGDDPAAFGEFLAALSSPDASQRTQAEAAFRALKERHAEGLVLKLLTFLSASDVPHLRSFSATLLRQVLTKEQPSLWTAVSQPYQEKIRSDLLLALTKEPVRDVRFKVADVIAELFSKIVGSECWPELIPFISQIIQQQHQANGTEIVEVCLHILAEIAPVLADSMDHSVEQFILMMQQSLSNQHPTIRLAAIQALKCFALGLDDLADVVKLKVLMEHVLMAFSAVHAGATEATYAYAILIELAEYVPSLFEDITKPVLTEFLKRAKDPYGDVNSKTMALEFLLTLIDGITESQFDDLKDCMAELVALLMEWLLQIEDVPDWHAHCGGSDGAASFGEVHDLAIESFDRIATSLPPALFLSLFSVYVQSWPHDPEWKKRHAILSVIGQMAEGCAAEISDRVMQLMQICTQALCDPHIRVRWAACQAIGLVADEVGSLIQTTHRDQIIAQLMQASVMDDPAAVYIQEHALRCLINLLQNSEHDLKGAVLDEIVKWIVQSMNFDQVSVNQAALESLSCVTSLLVAPAFAHHYNACMKAVFSSLQRIKDPNDLGRISAIVEIMTQIGVAAGKECFANESKLVIEYLKGLMDQASQLQDMDDQMAISIDILNSVARVCSIMGADFEALDVFKNLLLRSINTQPKLETVAMEDIDETDEDDHFKIDIAGKCFRIEKLSLAFCTCGMKTVLSMAQDLKRGFFPVLVPVLEGMMPAMDYKLIRDIRHLAIQSQPVLLECATDRHSIEPTENMRNFVLTLLNKQWEAFMGKLADMDQESNEISAPVVLDSVAKTIEVMKGAIEPIMMEVLFQKMQHVFQHFAKLRAERAAVQEGELTPEEQDEFTEEVSSEHSVIIGIQKVLSAVLVHSNDQYFESVRVFITSLHQLIKQLQSTQADYEILEVILTSMTDVVEYSQKGRELFGVDICNLFMTQLDHCFAAVRQIAAFGIGVIAQNSPSLFQPTALSALQKLTQVIQTQLNNLDSTGAATALDNAISALGKILTVHGSLLNDQDQSELLTLWLSQLPLRHDLEESLIVHHQLLQAVESEDRRLLGQNRENLIRVMEVLMEILANESPLASPEDLKRISALLNRLQHEQGCTQFAAQKMQKWSEEERAQFNKLMNEMQT